MCLGPTTKHNGHIEKKRAAAPPNNHGRFHRLDDQPSRQTTTGPAALPQSRQSTRNHRHLLRPLAYAVGALVKILRLPGTSNPTPKTLQQAIAIVDVQAWATAYDVELARHAVELRTWYFEDKTGPSFTS